MYFEVIAKAAASSPKNRQKLQRIYIQCWGLGEMKIRKMKDCNILYFISRYEEDREYFLKRLKRLFPNSNVFIRDVKERALALV